MSQYPGPGYPQQTPNYYAPMPPQAPLRPTAVTVLAIFGIIFGVLGVLCKPIGLAMMFVPQQAGVNPMVDLQRDMMAWNVINTVVGLAISVVLLAGSIGSLSLKPWARSAMISYAGLAVVMTLVNLVVTLIWIVPAMKQMQAQMPQQQGAPNMGAIMQTAGAVGAFVGAAVALIYPVLLWYFYNRPEIKAAFGGGQGGPGGFPVGQGGAAAGGYYYGNAAPPQAGAYYAQPPQAPGQYPPQQPPGQYPPQQ